MSEQNEIKKDSKKEHKKDKRLDLAAKILCFLFAFLLWFYVMIVESPGDERVIRDVRIHVALDDQRLLSKGLSVYVENEESVDITLSGKRRVLSRIESEDVEVKADLSAVSFAGKDISVPIVITPPDGCELVTASKYSVRINVDSAKKALVPLVAELEGKNPDYLYSETPVFSRIIDGSSVEYSAVLVEGPSSMVSDAAYAVVRIDADGKERDFSDIYSIELVDKNGLNVDHPFLKKEFDSINAAVTVRMEHTVPLSVVFKQDYFAGFNNRVTIEPAEVTLLITPADRTRTDLVPPLEIDEKKLLTADHIRTHYFETECYPVSAYGTVVSPSSVKVSVNIDAKVNNRIMSILDIYSTNGMEVDCEILDEVIEDVVFCGSAEMLSSLRLNDIVAIVDLSEYSAENIGRQYTKKVSIVIDSEASEDVFVVGDYTVQIKITEK